jgi:6-pyruvoyltetrahydropterin/6-carboxytetrahydropterin synthase
MFSVTKRFEFDAAHRVLGHGGRCRHLHGHTYTAEISLQRDNLDALGMVVDFGDIKFHVEGFINEFWDHNTILHPNDPLLEFLSKEEKHPYVMPSHNANPTAENMATELWEKTSGYFPGCVMFVRIYETKSSWADYSF